MVVFGIGLALAGGVDDGQPGADIEAVGRVEGEGAVGGGGFVARVEDGDGGEFDAAVAEGLDMDDGGEFVLALEVDIEAGEECAVERGDHAFVGAKNLLDNHAGFVLGLGDGDNAGGEEVVAFEFEGVEDVEGAEDIGDEAVGGFEIAEVVAEEGFVEAGELAGAHLAVALEDLRGAEEFPARGGGEFEAFRRVDFFEFGKDLVAEWLLGMAEDVEAPDPTKNRDADEQENENGPAEQAALVFASGLGGIRIGILEPGAAVFGLLAGRHRLRRPPRPVRTKCHSRRIGWRGDCGCGSPRRKGRPRSRECCPRGSERWRDR